MIYEYDKQKNERRRATCFIAVVGSEIEVGDCRDSIEKIRLRSGDSSPVYFRGTKGYEARQSAIEKFRASNHGCILLLDQDQVFPADTLERLRSHGLPFVSGLYMRRMYQPIAPVWAERPVDDFFPMKPWLDNPEQGKLYELGASGWGCILIHREVFDAVEPLLKGEPFVIEDDMDIHPYNLDNVMKAINEIDYQVKGEFDKDIVTKAITMLKQEIRPLRGLKDCVGSDIRFPYFAHLAGYPLIGDPSVRCGHMLNYPLSPDDYDMNHEKQTEVKSGLDKQVNELRQAIEKRRQELATIRLGGEV